MIGTGNITSISTYAPRFLIMINNMEIGAEVSHTIRSVMVEQELNRTNTFRLDVQDEFTGMGFKWLGHGLFNFGNSITVILGYSYKMIRMLEGKIQDIAAQFTEGLAPTFAVEGADSSYVFLTTPSEAWTFTEKTDHEIVQEIARMARMQAVVDETRQVNAVKIKRAGDTYFSFLQDLAADNGYQFSLSGRQLHFARPSRRNEPAVALMWGKNIISFQPRINTSRTLTRVVVRAWDRTRRQQIEATANAGEEGQQEGRRRLASQITREAHGDAVRVITNRPVQSVEEARNLARSELERSSSNLVTGTVETVGIPELSPGMCVAIGGLGEWFSGKYYIRKITHRIDSNGYRTTLEVERNAL